MCDTWALTVATVIASRAPISASLARAQYGQRLPGLSMRVGLVGNPVHEPSSHRGGEDRLTGGDLADRLHQPCRWRVLEQNAGGRS
jgi:hypothetical protein